MKAIQVRSLGGPEVLVLESDVALPAVKPGDLLIRHHAIGVNYIDVYFRLGTYPMPLPFIPGREGAGVVEAIGAEVTDFKVGDRVCYPMFPGSYAEYSAVPADKVVPMPAGLSFEQATAAMLQGLTAHYLTESTFPIAAGQTALIHAAAGGAGLLLTQMARRRGARVIATVSTEEKAAVAREAGAHEVILYTKSDFQAETRRLSDGRGVDVVYDSVGLTTFDGSLACLRPRGTLVLFGASSGPVPPVEPMRLNNGGSLFLTRPSLAHHLATRAELLARAADVLGWVAAGELKLRIGHTFPLAEAAASHRAIESRATTGKLLLIP